MSSHVVIAVSDLSSVGESRRRASVISQDAGLNREEQGQLAIIVTELATNLAVHAQNGRLLIQSMNVGLARGVEVVSIDSGPGIKDIGQCMRDGFSTTGTAGNGLGAVRRMSDEFDVYSDRSGTVIVSRLIAKSDASPKTSFHWGAISVAVKGEEVCGDSWRVHARNGHLGIMVADGLGHGPLAAEASGQAIEVFDRASTTEPVSVIESAHQALSRTRGAAVAVARVHKERGLLNYAGVGNISGALLNGATSRGLVSHNGTAGLLVPRVQQFDYPCGERDVLVMHSDGLTSRWTLEQYPGLQSRHPSVIAGVLYRDFTRGKDDVTVVVVKSIEQKAT
jgi:anti-sigma regulatory factor (Ser/Thr protein kinase)